MIAALTGWARSLILTGAARAARWRWPAALDGIAAGTAIGSIKVYQLLLSPWLGRQCLFHPTCSHRAIQLLAQRGWNCGMPEVDRQLKRCSGNFVLRLAPNGEVELETADGTIVPQSSLSLSFLDRFQGSGSQGFFDA